MISFLTFVSKLMREQVLIWIRGCILDVFFLLVGGACGFGDAVEKAPFSAKVSAGGPSLFKSGKGCGACYEVNHSLKN